MLTHAAKVELPDTPIEKCFPDVETDKWYHASICGAHTLGIANGFESGKF